MPSSGSFVVAIPGLDDRVHHIVAVDVQRVHVHRAKQVVFDQFPIRLREHYENATDLTLEDSGLNV